MYESSNLDARQRGPVVQATRTTQMLGSPAAPPGGSHSSVPPLRVRPGSATTRYSFVSTPPPAGGAPVRPHDVGPDWKPDPELDPAPCRPLCRELFAFGVEHCFVIGVTAVPELDRDKAEFAASLALAMSATGHARVLLVDADLDHPAQHRLMRAEMPPGATFSRQIQAHMTRQGDEHWSVLRCTKSLHVLVDGPEPSPGLIMSRTFEECLRALRAYYDFIVVDGPPGSRESECRALDGVIDGLIVVCTEATRTTIPETSRYFTTKRFSKAIRATR
jgi:Mrp family chromosome partitioning ATPase